MFTMLLYKHCTRCDMNTPYFRIREDIEFLTVLNVKKSLENLKTETLR
jgi:hypothetical protein